MSAQFISVCSPLPVAVPRGAELGAFAAEVILGVARVIGLGAAPAPRGPQLSPAQPGRG